MVSVGGGETGRVAIAVLARFLQALTGKAVLCQIDATNRIVMMRVASLTHADVLPYRALMLEAYAMAPDAFTSTPQERAAEPESWWLNRIADPSGLTAVFGAFNAGDLVGTVALEFASKPKTRHKCHLIGMYVKPMVRGCGAGRLLVSAAISHARARSGLEVITLTVTQGNAPAQGLYRSVGFRRFGIESMAIRSEGRYLSKVHMWMALGSAGTAAFEATSES